MRDSCAARAFNRRATHVVALVVVGLGAMSASASAAPVPHVDPPTLEFMDPLGGAGTSPQIVTLTNTGDTAMFVGDVSVAGAGFTITSDGCSQKEVHYAGDPSPTEGTVASCAVAVAFAATDPGEVPGVLTFPTGPTSGPAIVELTGLGTGPRAVVEPAGGRTFSAPAGTTSAAQRVTLRNAGNEPLTHIDAALIGTNFAVVTDQCTGTTLATTGPASDCIVDVTFSPAAASGYGATLRFTSNDPVRPIIDVPLGGSGSPAIPSPLAPPLPPPGDSDGDGVADGADSCPTVGGDLASGCPGDRDDDGVLDNADTCKTTPGDLKNGCPSELNADVVGRWRVNKLLTELLSLTVRAPVGSRIQLRCGGRPKLCPFRTRIITRTTKRTTGLTNHFKGKRILRAHMVITVRVSRSQQIGVYERLETRTGRRLPRVTQRCLRAGTGTVQACP